MSQPVQPPRACQFCGGDDFRQVFVYREPPAGEVRFAFSSRGLYHREVWGCRVCGHMVSLHQMGEAGLYAGDYVTSTYGEDGLRRAFDRITALDPTKSDNVGRVKCVDEFGRGHLPARDREPTVLDVGSGLCVFLHRMKEAGWGGTALDPDPRAAEHARVVAGVGAVCGDFFQVEDLPRFDAVTFNKVLEHVPDPVAMLARAGRFVRPDGFVYVELPDGEAAEDEGPGREEFFVEHYHVFSLASLALLAARAGFRVRRIERLREPSTKFTLRAFLIPQRAGSGAA